MGCASEEGPDGGGFGDQPGAIRPLDPLLDCGIGVYRVIVEVHFLNGRQWYAPGCNLAMLERPGSRFPLNLAGDIVCGHRWPVSYQGTRLSLTWQIASILPWQQVTGQVAC